MKCSWLYHPIHNHRGVVECRYCHKFESYSLSGYKPEPPERECEREQGMDYWTFAKLTLEATRPKR